MALSITSRIPIPPIPDTRGNMWEKLYKTGLPLLAWLLLWEAAARLIGRQLFLPAPAATFSALWNMARTLSFWQSVGASIGRVLIGFAIGAVVGMLFGVLTALFSWCDWLLSPALRAVRTAPVVSFILLLYFCLPTRRVPYAVSALMVLPVMWRSTRQGISAADPLLIELASAYRFGRWKTFRLVYLPAAFPALAAGWETSLGLAWKSGVTAEVLCQPKFAIGSGLQAAKSYLDTPGLLAWTIVILLCSLTMERLFQAALRRWKGVYQTE